MTLNEVYAGVSYRQPQGWFVLKGFLPKFTFWILSLGTVAFSGQKLCKTDFSSVYVWILHLAILCQKCLSNIPEEFSKFHWTSYLRWRTFLLPLTVAAPGPRLSITVYYQNSAVKASLRLSVFCWMWSLPWDGNYLLPPILLTSHSSPRGQWDLLRIMFPVSSRNSIFTQEGKATKVWKCSKICKSEEDWETVFIFPAGMCLKVKTPQLAEFF